MDIKTMKPLAVVLALLAFSTANANDHIGMSHKVIASESVGMYQSISLTLTINNEGMEDLHNVKISPSGSEFASHERDSVINVGFLPAMGQTVIQLTADTPMAKEYFQSMMPVHFLLNAKFSGGENMELPLFSQGEGQ